MMELKHRYESHPGPHIVTVCRSFLSIVVIHSRKCRWAIHGLRAEKWQLLTKDSGFPPQSRAVYGEVVGTNAVKVGECGHLNFNEKQAGLK